MLSHEYRQIKVVSFDVWKTLITVCPDYKAARIDAIRRQLALPAQETSEVARIVATVDDDLNARADITGIQYGTVDRLVRIAGHFGFQPTSDWLTETTAALRDNFISNPPRLNEPDLVESLQRIKQNGRQIVVISNTGFTDGLHVRLGLEALGLWKHIDYGIFSDQVGCAKPNPEIFRLATRMTGTAADRILHVGDNYTADYRGATAAGLKALHLTTMSHAHGISAISQLTTLLSERTVA